MDSISPEDNDFRSTSSSSGYSDFRRHFTRIQYFQFFFRQNTIVIDLIPQNTVILSHVRAKDIDFRSHSTILDFFVIRIPDCSLNLFSDLIQLFQDSEFHAWTMELLTLTMHGAWLEKLDLLARVN